MVSAKNQTSTVVKGFELGCNDWIHKPFDRQELIARVKHHLQVKSFVAEGQESVEGIAKAIASPPPTITTKIETSVLFMIAVVPEDSPAALQLFEEFEALAEKHKMTRT